MDPLGSITLRNGVLLPSVGLGTYRARGADAHNAVRAALSSGIRHIDTATIYKARVCDEDTHLRAPGCVGSAH
jgi:diketogulonate reductase-like aldo/keto reductase